MSELFTVAGLTGSYGKISAVRDIDLTIAEGGVVTVIGPNGAGKSTLLNSLMGLHPSRGAITFEGRRVDQLSVEERLERGMCLVAEGRELFGTMSVEDNLLLGAYVQRRHGRSQAREDIEKVYAQFPRLKERRSQEAGTLSGGERQMLAIGRALMSRPRLLMLDEPSLGLAPLIVAEVFRIIATLRQSGVSILLVEQNARAALHASDFGYVLETGDIVLSGPSRDLLCNPLVEEAYLGASIEGGEANDAEAVAARSPR
ncbi:branched-chain amino acid transport system ATP-binding protein [Rhodoligotrophos appendicifer]|uniref:ABC transporter ATP-binding protein n=1 Tax=Rhodoligotrophos appendicifer TaxID=987056 RepID=UPI0011870C9E|nr:ABC transporter ATP-binding protein [Rhodoligotrophos appendicifer]